MVQNEIAAMLGFAEVIIILMVLAFLILSIIGLVLVIRFLYKKNKLKKEDPR